MEGKTGGRKSRADWRRNGRGGYAASRKRPLSIASRTIAVGREQPLGPYETRYDIRIGYELERNLIRP